MELEGKHAHRIALPSGRVVYFTQLAHTINHASAVSGFQVVREGLCEFTVYVVPAAERCSEEIERELMLPLVRLLGNEAQIDIACVGEIPLTPGGKRAKYVSHVG